MSLVAHVPELPGYVQYFGGVAVTCHVDLGRVDIPPERDPDPRTGMYVGKLDAFVPRNFDRASSWDWYEKCLPLPCSKCGLTITHIHGKSGSE